MAEEERKRFLDGNEMELGENQGRNFEPKPSSPRGPAPLVSRKESPIPPVLSYCASSIMMTVANKYILSFPEFNLNFFLLAVQVNTHQSDVARTNTDESRPLSALLQSPHVKQPVLSRIVISRRMKQRNVSRHLRIAKMHILTFSGFPISLLLIAMIYTSTWALRYLSIPVYTIFKNLTIILIAYGEVLWFGGAVSSMALFSFGLMVLSSIIAAWADIKHALDTHGTATGAAAAQLATLNAGYIWMMFNCLSTASYVLYMRKRIKLTNFKDFDSKCQSRLFTS